VTQELYRDELLQQSTQPNQRKNRNYRGSKPMERQRLGESFVSQNRSRSKVAADDELWANQRQTDPVCAGQKWLRPANEAPYRTGRRRKFVKEQSTGCSKN
jgi:hypothetical protein